MGLSQVLTLAIELFERVREVRSEADHCTCARPSVSRAQQITLASDALHRHLVFVAAPQHPIDTGDGLGEGQTERDVQRSARNIRAHQCISLSALRWIDRATGCRTTPFRDLPPDEAGPSTSTFAGQSSGIGILQSAAAE